MGKKKKAAKKLSQSEEEVPLGERGTSMDENYDILIHSLNVLGDEFRARAQGSQCQHGDRRRASQLYRAAALLTEAL